MFWFGFNKAIYYNFGGRDLCNSAIKNAKAVESTAFRSINLMQRDMVFSSNLQFKISEMSNGTTCMLVSKSWDVLLWAIGIF